MKKQEKDNLRSLFQDMELSNPPQGFENRLMQQIHQVAAKKEERKTLRNKIYIGFSIFSGIAGMVALPVLIFYFTTGNMGFELPSLKFDYNMSSLPRMDINPLAILLPFVVLVLLMGDTLIRKHLSDKRHHNL